ncbi:MAG: nuclear transport factor 2 family protein [Nitrososphaera sp.]|jgi:ketosteroid isomerase-like protein
MARNEDSTSNLPKSIITISNEQMVQKYFRLISQKDVRGLLDLFSEDAVLYEPFSNVPDGLHGKTAIENFLRIAVMANAGMKRTIKLTENTDDSITAVVTFERGDEITGRFAFHFVTDETGKNIRELRIRFKE